MGHSFNIHIAMEVISSQSLPAFKAPTLCPTRTAISDHENRPRGHRREIHAGVKFTNHARSRRRAHVQIRDGSHAYATPYDHEVQAVFAPACAGARGARAREQTRACARRARSRAHNSVDCTDNHFSPAHGL